MVEKWLQVLNATFFIALPIGSIINFRLSDIQDNILRFQFLPAHSIQKVENNLVTKRLGPIFSSTDI